MTDIAPYDLKVGDEITFGPKIIFDGKIDFVANVPDHFEIVNQTEVRIDDALKCELTARAKIPGDCSIIIDIKMDGEPGPSASYPFRITLG